MLHRLLHVLLVIERFNLVFPAFLLMGMLAVDLLIVCSDILLLYKSRVGQHERAKIPRSRRTIDITLETQLDNIWNQPGMINVRVRKHHTIQGLRIKAQIPVRSIGFHAFTLVHATVQQNSVPRIGSDKMFATRHFTGSSEKLNFHGLNDFMAQNYYFFCIYANFFVTLHDFLLEQ